LQRLATSNWQLTVDNQRLAIGKQDDNCLGRVVAAREQLTQSGPLGPCAKSIEIKREEKSGTHQQMECLEQKCLAHTLDEEQETDNAQARLYRRYIMGGLSIWVLQLSSAVEMQARLFTRRHEVKLMKWKRRTFSS